MAELLTFVDENDNPIGSGDRKEAWTKGLYTRNIRVMIRDENGRILSQKRSVKKGTYPGMWTVAASGHVDAGEEWDVAATRETHEEIGVAVEVHEVGRFNFSDDSDGKKVRQVIRVYEGVISSSTQFKLEENEVDDIQWYDLDDLKLQMVKTPDDFTPSFHETTKRFYEGI